ncbi:MAG: serine hydrolase [Planctomycetes bacterium]|nr:serine hydrolase [Planctomycetota bacterium]
MNIIKHYLFLLLYAGFISCSLHAQQVDTGLAPEVIDLNSKDVSLELERKLPYLKEPYISSKPTDLNDGILVGELGVDGGDKEKILAFAQEISKPSNSPKNGNTDSLLLAHKGTLVFESYFRRGRANYPHYQMSITKSYTGLAIGRAIQLGHLKMKDLDRPIHEFLKEIDTKDIVAGAENITLHEAMHMYSGIRLDREIARKLRSKPEQLKGQGQIHAYLKYSSPIDMMDRKFKYQASDPAMTMQVLEAVVPGSAKDFINNELMAPLGITSYHWQDDISGLPKSAAGCSIRSRDMLKFGLLLMNKGKWKGKQLISSDFIARAISPIIKTYRSTSYGYFWWIDDVKVGSKTYHTIQGRGAGGQFIYMLPELDLIAVMTSHNKGMGKMLHVLPPKLVAAFQE